jgi:hypothetical protein
MLDQEPWYRDSIRLTEALVHFDIVNFASQDAGFEHVKSKIVHGC